ncbi:MAG: TonB family protein, partial [Cyclobacteriaceae bacterium]|nr:TonB family protein [Cyclobacteriaceae bacterium]
MNDWEGYIEKYRKGELTPSEMHSLEKKALSYPFLADALEGAETISATHFSEDIEELKQSIHHQTEQKSVVSFEQAKMASAPAPKQVAKEQPNDDEGKSKNKSVWPLRIAASLFVMLSVFWAANQLTSNEEEENLALTKEVDTKKKTPTPSQNAPDSVDAVREPAASPPSKLLVEKPKNIVASKQIEIISKGFELVAVTEEGKRQTTLLDMVEEKTTLAQGISEEKEIKVTELARSESDMSSQLTAPLNKSTTDTDADPVSKRKSVTTQLIRGQVLSLEDGQPLPRVNVVIQGTTDGAVTDMNGKYHIAVEALNPKLVFSFVGFQTKEVPVGNQKEVNINLDPDLTQLSEVVVTGTAASDYSQNSPIVKPAEPAGGRKAYDKYLKNSLRYPVEAKIKKIKGRVTVKFTVRTDGTLDEFSVVKSLGYG